MSDPVPDASDVTSLASNAGDSAFSPELLARLDGMLADTDALLAAEERARSTVREPEPWHVCYVPADHVTPDTARTWGDAAVAALEEIRAEDVALDPAVLADVAPRVRAVLAREPVADLRADLEDGYRGADEDTDAAAAGAAVAGLLAGRRAPRRAGARVKSMEAATRRRGLESWARFLGAFLDAGGDPGRVRVTLPKVSFPAQVAAFSSAMEALEEHHGIGPVPLEIQVETPRALLSPSGAVSVAPIVEAAGGRAAGLHYGTYDYSAALGLDPDRQRADHPAAEHAKAIMQVAGAAVGVPVCDGSSALLPVGEARRAAWRVQARIVRRACELGIGQGWDMHPAQVPARLLVMHAFHRAGAPAAIERLRAYRAGAASGVLDEPATERALAGFLRRGLAVGALDPAEVADLPPRM